MLEKFEKIEHDIYVTEKKLKAAENKKKALEQSVRKLLPVMKERIVFALVEVCLKLF